MHCTVAGGELKQDHSCSQIWLTNAYPIIRK